MAPVPVSGARHIVRQHGHAAAFYEDGRGFKRMRYLNGRGAGINAAGPHVDPIAVGYEHVALYFSLCEQAEIDMRVVIAVEIFDLYVMHAVCGDVFRIKRDVPNVPAVYDRFAVQPDADTVVRHHADEYGLLAHVQLAGPAHAEIIGNAEPIRRVKHPVVIRRRFIPHDLRLAAEFGIGIVFSTKAAVFIAGKTAILRLRAAFGQRRHKNGITEKILVVARGFFILRAQNIQPAYQRQPRLVILMRQIVKQRKQTVAHIHVGMGHFFGKLAVKPRHT